MPFRLRRSLGGCCWASWSGGVCAPAVGCVLWRGGSRPVGGSCCGSFSFCGCCRFFSCSVGACWWGSRVLRCACWLRCVVCLRSRLCLSGGVGGFLGVALRFAAVGLCFRWSVVCGLGSWLSVCLLGSRCGCGCCGCGGFRFSGLAAVGFGGVRSRGLVLCRCSRLLCLPRFRCWRRCWWWRFVPLRLLRRSVPSGGGAFPFFPIAQGT